MAFHAHRSLLSGFLCIGLFAACGGEVVFWESDLSTTGCASPPNCQPRIVDMAPCAPLHPEGQCDDGRTCVAGVCHQKDMLPPSCQAGSNGLCPNAAACIAGECVAITGTTACGVDNPWGLCPGGEACVNGRIRSHGRRRRGKSGMSHSSSCYAKGSSTLSFIATTPSKAPNASSASRRTRLS